MEPRAAPRDGLMDGKVDRKEGRGERFSVFMRVCVCESERVGVCGYLRHELSQGNPVYLALSFSSQS